MALMQTLQDNFNDNIRDPALWQDPASAQIVEANQNLEITTIAGGAYYYYISVSTYALTDSYLSARLVDAGNQALASLEAVLRLDLDANNSIWWAVNGNYIRAWKKVGGGANTQVGADIAYNSYVHRWFRIRDAGGTVYFETSRDNVFWRTRQSLSTPFTVSYLAAKIGAGTWAAEGSTSTIKWDDVSGVPPAVEAAATLIDNFDDNARDATLWQDPASAQIVEANQNLEITTTLAANYFYYRSLATYNLTSSYAMARLLDDGGGTIASLEAILRLEIDSDDALWWSVSGGQMRAYYKVGGGANTQVGADITYTEGQHNYFRIREYAGTTYWETSIDGVIWQARQSIANVIAVTTLAVYLGAGTYNAELSTSTVKWSSFNVVPALGAIPYIGVWEGAETGARMPDTLAGVTRLEKQLGWHLDILHFYANWADAFTGLNADALAAINAHGAIPMLSWGPSYGAVNQLLQRITAGDYDADIDEWAAGIAGLGFPIFLRTMWEMNTTSMDWGIGTNNNVAVDFAPAWQRVHNRFVAAGATNVSWVWCPNVEYTGTEPIANVYPGDAYVDWTGLDGYNGGTELPWGGWMDFALVFNNAYFPSYDNVVALAPTKPMMIAEMASVEGGGDKAEWITQTFDAIRRAYPSIEAVVWFDETWGAGSATFRIDSSAASLAAFAAIAHGGAEIYPDYPVLSVEMALTTNPTATPTWTDVTDYVHEIRIHRGRQRELDRVEASTASILLDNQDRRFDPSYTAGPYYGNLLPMRRVRVRAQWQAITYDVWYGYVESWPPTWKDRVVPLVQVEAVDGWVVLGRKKLNTSYSAELSGARLHNILDDTGWTLGSTWILDSAVDSLLGTTTILAPNGGRIIAGGNTTIQATTLSDTAALAHAQDVALAENGYLFIGNDGSVVFINRHYKYSKSFIDPQYSFGDAADELQYTDLAYAYDDKDTYNDIRMMRVGGAVQTASDATSQAKYFIRTLSQENLLASTDAEMLDRANWSLNRYKEPQLRISNIAFEVADTDLWEPILAIDLFTPITVTRRPTVGTAITANYTVEGIEHVISPGQKWQTAYRLLPIDSTTYWTLTDGSDGLESYSVLGTTTVLAY